MEYTADQRMAREIARLVTEMGGRSFYVGGFVRDKLLHIDNQDVVMEVWKKSWILWVSGWPSAKASVFSV